MKIVAGHKMHTFLIEESTIFIGYNGHGETQTESIGDNYVTIFPSRPQRLILNKLIWIFFRQSGSNELWTDVLDVA